MPEIDLGRVLVAVIAAIYCRFFIYTAWLSAHEWVIVSLLAQKGTITDGQIICRRLRNGEKQPVVASRSVIRQAMVAIHLSPTSNRLAGDTTRNW